MSVDLSLAALIDARASPAQKEFLLAAVQVAARLRTPLYLVGGAVRDLIATGELRDLDLVVEGDGIELARQLADQIGASFRAHDRFLTSEVASDDIRADVAAARTETYDRPAALPVVSAGNLDDDLSRRDFTINSMAHRLWPAEPTLLIDPFSGQRDLEEGRLKVLHKQSFIDDPTRILRGVRLGSRLGMEMEPKTLGLAAKAVRSGAVDHLSTTRLRQELTLLLEEPEVEESLRRLDELGFLRFLGREAALEAHEWNTIGRLSDQRGMLESVCESRPTVRWWLAYLTALTLDIPAASRLEIAQRLGLDQDLETIVVRSADRLKRAASVLSDAAMEAHKVRRTLEGLTAEEIILLRATTEGQVQQWIDQWWRLLRQIELGINGTDLVEAGFSPGPEIGRALEATLDARVDGLIEPSQELQFAIEELLGQERGRIPE